MLRSSGSSAGVTRGFVRNPQDFYGGLVLIAFAAFAFWAGGDLPGIQGYRFGPGTAPRLFAGMLMAMGAAIAVSGLLADGPLVENRAVRAALFGAMLVLLFLVVAGQIAKVPRIARYNFVIASAAVDIVAFCIARFSLQGPVLVTAAILTFAGCIRELGLVITTFTTIMIAAAASDEVRWVESTIWAAALTTFCVFLFRNALNLPLPLWPIH